MKMSEVFKLPLYPLYLRYVADGADDNEPEEVVADKNSYDIIEITDNTEQGFNCSFENKQCTAIIKAVNSHDTYLADIDRLLDRLRPFAELIATPIDENSTLIKLVWAGKFPEMKIMNFLGAEHFNSAHQTYTELIKTYGER